MAKSTWGLPDPKPITMKKKPKPISRVRKVTNEGKLFSEILSERSIGGKTYSQVSATLIENPNHFNLHHLLPKSHYPAFRLRKDAIVILTETEHFDFHNNTAKVKADPKWKWLFDKIEELKEEYNRKGKAA